MRKKATIASIVYAVLLLFSVSVVVLDVKAPTVINVPGDYTSIQEAINAANAGDTILVQSGATYFENVVINKTLTVAGENKESTIIDGRQKGPTINITANNVCVKDLTIRNGTYDVYLFFSIGDIITNNIIDHGTGESGICLDNSRSNTIANNTIDTAGDSGIYLYYSNNNIVSQNNSTGNVVGIWISHSSYNTIAKNNLGENDYGIWLYYSRSNVLRENNMTLNTCNFGVDGAILAEFIQDIDVSNKVNEKPIYYWINQHNKQIPENAGYAAAVNSTNITAKNLDLENNLDGILLAYTTNSNVERNTITNSSNYAIRLYKSHDNTIKHNSIISSRDGVCLSSSNDNIVDNNAITDCTEYGVWILSSTGNTISRSNITSNGIGAILYSSSNSEVFGNNIDRNTYGIWLSYSSNNKVYHNNFNNTIQTRISGVSVNLWDDGYYLSGGNHWSDYAGEDLDGDRIGDTPYVINAANRDNRPLIELYIEGDINHDGEVDSLDLIALNGAYGAAPSNPQWNPSADINHDGIIDILDLRTLGINYGRVNP